MHDQCRILIDLVDMQIEYTSRARLGGPHLDMECINNVATMILLTKILLPL